ncbi:MAG: ACP S-malonyltransferase, partial [Bacteroidales bacterium]
MNAYVFPGQGAQFPGMGKPLYDGSSLAREMFDKADKILGFDISNIMFEGTADELKATKVTQPAIFLHSVILAATIEGLKPEMVAGHSLGEFSALTVAKSLKFEDALRLVSIRAQAMQKCCEANPGTMAAIIGLSDEAVE